MASIHGSARGCAARALQSRINGARPRNLVYHRATHQAPERSSTRTQLTDQLLGIQDFFVTPMQDMPQSVRAGEVALGQLVVQLCQRLALAAQLLSLHPSIQQRIKATIEKERSSSSSIPSSLGATLDASNAMPMDVPTEQSDTLVLLQLEDALMKAKLTAQQQAQWATETVHINQALRHTNFNIASQLRKERQMRCELKLRIEKLKWGSKKGFDISCDPAVERAAQQLVGSEEMSALERQLLELRQEVTMLRAEVSAHKARAEECVVPA